MTITTKYSRLSVHPIANSKEIALIPANTKLKVIDQKWITEPLPTWYYKVNFNGKMGWVSARTIAEVSGS
jgi:hypothetical protein